MKEVQERPSFRFRVSPGSMGSRPAARPRRAVGAFLFLLPESTMLQAS